ncbi:AAA family ATPase [Segatella bryantii]|uniref:AAA family ATPase n=1 Tax=Segatella bryantii TaxID=77095 RepID=UPI00242FF0EB|nr:AAA family ATPase [Segatella bryantii]
MIQKVFIKNYRNINTEDFEIRPLTIFTGLNSTGKSSCFFAILDLMYENKDLMSLLLLRDYNFSFAANRNRNNSAKEYCVKITDTNDQTLKMRITQDKKNISGNLSLNLEDTLFYLSANRLGYNYPAELVSDQFRVGFQGEYLYGTFEKRKSQKLDDKLIKDNNSYTLSTQVSYWLSYILKNKFEMHTEKINDNNIKVSYTADGIDNLSPRQLGVGVSYLVKVIIMCLTSNIGDVLMIENPEIHLHPGAQSRLGEFFAFIASAGIQILLETHSEHMLDSVQYQIFKNNLSSQDAVLYYKSNIEENFIRLDYQNDGHYNKEFPTGFFDATLSELLELE